MRDTSAFDYPMKWSIYEEPKPKKKVTLYSYTYKYSAKIFQSDWSERSFDEVVLPLMTLLKTESKEIEVIENEG